MGTKATHLWTVDSWRIAYNRDKCDKCSRASGFIQYNENINENITYIIQVHMRALIQSYQVIGHWAQQALKCVRALILRTRKRRLDIRRLCEISELN